MTTESPNTEVLEAISLLADTVQVVADNLQNLADNTDRRFNRIESQMVTKSYLDDKLADLKGDMVSMLRKEDQKVNRLIDVLAEKRVLEATEAKDVLSYKVFP